MRTEGTVSCGSGAQHLARTSFAFMLPHLGAHHSRGAGKPVVPPVFGPSPYPRSSPYPNPRESLGAGRADWRDTGRRFPLGAVVRPIGHQSPPLLKQVAAPIGSFSLVSDDVRERHFADFV